MFLRHFFIALMVITLPTFAAAQGTIAFGSVKTDPGAPVEVSAENLEVNQTDGSARFTGNVVIIQGVMRLSADIVHVTYKTGDDQQKTGIESLNASGDVILVNGPDAAEANTAEYNIDSGTITMTGNVLLTQGAAVLTSNKMVVNLTSGTAEMAGRVKTILNPNGN
ncbi:LptA/OstA family protein [Epibacterium ulvae]|uniref:LptA/OstA family protein n=1 Tax=Epibacterium ulvae TaxID=1156985 RepID=UPI001BFC2B75|nr:LptA/OstA family protein [Epibacterium ulvae]MBT8153532.1 LptA/OstA family protein [Epibacterium ulvae]